MQAVLEREIPGAQAMFVQGGAGDINPLFLGRSEDEATDFGIAQKMADLLAAQVIAASRKVVPVSAGPIQRRSQMLEFRHRWDKDKKLTVGITTALIGRDIAIATVPGEPFHALQKIGRRSPKWPTAVLRLYVLERRNVGGLCSRSALSGARRLRCGCVHHHRSRRRRAHCPATSDQPVRHAGNVARCAGAAMILTTMAAPARKRMSHLVVLSNKRIGKAR